jgi:predicted permease
MMVARCAGLFGRRRRERELDEEIRHHLEMLADRYIQDGLSAEHAWNAARRDFGRVAAVKEAYRHQRGLPMIEIVLQDLRYGIRSLRRAPVFTLAALISLTLGIGANSAIFSVVNAVLLRPLPYPESDRLVHVTRLYSNGAIGSSLDGRLYHAVADDAATFESVTAIGSTTGFNLAFGTEATYVRAMPVTASYFNVLRTPPQIGRPFTPQEDTPNGGRVAVVSHGLWQRFLNGDAGAIGQSVQLSGEPYTVIGVMPEGFRSVPAVDVWVPLQLARSNTGGFNFAVIGRQAGGTGMDQVASEMRAITEGGLQANPDFMFEGQVLFPRSYQDVLSGNVRTALLLLLGAVSVVLLIACVNVANLFIARALSRGREIAIRAALGAGRRRIMGQLLAESLILAGAAGGVGLIVAWVVGPALLDLWPGAGAEWRSATLDARVLLVTAALSITTGIVFGTLPAFTLDSSGLAGHLRDDGTRTTQSRRAGWIRGALVASEVALAVVLLIGAGLLVRTFVNLRSVDVGFETEGLITAQMSPNSPRFRDSAELSAFYRQGLERVRAIPGVQGAAVVSGLPVERGLNVLVHDVEGPGGEEEMKLTDLRYVTPEYFSVMGIPIGSGRTFDVNRDVADAQPVALVNQEFARRFLGEEQPIGRHLQVYARGPMYEIVGVVQDVQEMGVGRDPHPVMYVPVDQAQAGFLALTHGFFPISWVLRARAGSGDVAAQVRAAIRAIDPMTPFSSFRTMDQVVAASLSTPRFHVVLISLFSGLALVLASAGIYGVMTYAVSARTREIGVRIAIGASAATIVRTVVGQGVLLAVAGVVVGLIGAAGLTRLLESFVFGVSTYDPTSFLAAAVGLLLVAVLASAIPALRAARVDPVRTLRTE